MKCLEVSRKNYLQIEAILKGKNNFQFKNQIPLEEARAKKTKLF